MKTFTITFLNSKNETLADYFYTDCISRAEAVFRIRNKDIKQILSLD